MDPLKILSWNVNGITNRLIEVQQFALENQVDILCIQETKHRDNERITIPGYHHLTKQSLVKNTDSGNQVVYRGLITYYKTSLAVKTCESPNLGNNTDTLSIGVHNTKGEQLFRITNTYAPAQALKIDRVDLEDQNNPLLIVGDLNAVHPRLGSLNGRRNQNGIELYNYISSEDCNLRILSNEEATHIKGNRLDYFCLVGNRDIHSQCEIVDTLTSDHYGVYAEILINTTFKRYIPPRKRLTIPKHKESEIREYLNEWHDNYEPSSTEQYNEDICKKLEEGINKTCKRSQRPEQAPMNKWYNGDEAVKRINKQYRKAKQNWMKNPSKENLTVFRRMEKQVQNVKMNSREKYWTSFLQKINSNTPQKEIARRVRIAQGRHKKEPRHPNPEGKANELLTQWITAASTEALPLKVRAAVEARVQKKMSKLRKALQKMGRSDDKPITEEEFKRCLNKGQSTAPGLDGITYNAIRFLATVNGNPVLKLFNMIWTGAPIPRAWKKALLIPIPKPGKPGEFRPVSLTSCLCKLFERIILNRLNYFIKEKFAKCLYGFIPGRSTQHCIHRVSSGLGLKYTVFIDLKGAFDRANHNVILTELADMINGRLLQLVKEYLEDRSSCVYFEGVLSRWETMELGTPQGGVLSPTLFNIIMNIIGRMKLKNAILTIYADDIVIQADTKRDIKNAIQKFTKTCNSVGLVISPEKTKMIAIAEHNPLVLKIQGKLIERVNFYKYMGVIINKRNHRKHEIKKLKQTTTSRLKLLWTVACGSVGATVPLVRQLYTSMIRSVIDYSSSTLLPLKKSYINALEIIQNKAARGILGLPKCVRQEALRNEAGLTTIEHRITTTAITQLYRSISTEDDGLTKDTLYNNHRRRLKNPWVKAARELIQRSNIADFIEINRNIVNETPPWEIPEVGISTTSLQGKKDTITDEQLKQDFLQRINDIGEGTHFYTDGSLLEDGRAGCGVVSYTGGKEVDTLSIRISEDCPITQAELLGIVAALSLARKTAGNVVIASDSLSALQSLTSDKAVHNILVRRALSIIARCHNQGRQVGFIWTPSHCGIIGNERADELAKKGALKNKIDYSLPPSITKLKESVGKEILEEYKTRVRRMTQECYSIERYFMLTKGNPPRYKEAKLETRRQQTTYSRLRLQNRYLWEVLPIDKVSDTKCKLCEEPRKHTLGHYLLECEALDGHRPQGTNVSEEEMLRHFLQPDVLKKTLTNYPRFACSR